VLTSFLATFSLGGYTITHFGININDIVSISCVDIQKICTEGLPIPTIHIPVLETIQPIKGVDIYPIHYSPTFSPIHINPVNLKILIGGCFIILGKMLLSFVCLIWNILNKIIQYGGKTRTRRYKGRTEKSTEAKRTRERNYRRRSRAIAKANKLSGSGDGGDDGEKDREKKNNNIDFSEDYMSLLELLLNIIEDLNRVLRVLRNSNNDDSVEFDLDIFT